MKIEFEDDGGATIYIKYDEQDYVYHLTFHLVKKNKVEEEAA